MTRAESPVLRQIPNTLTVLRLCAVPVFAYLLVREDGHSRAAGLLFMGAAFTDFLDGLIARRAGYMTQFGKVLDPLVDRLLIVTTAVLLAHYDRVPDWSVLIVILRDLATVIGFFVVRRRTLPDVTPAGKLGTAFIMAGFAFLLVFSHDYWPLYVFWIGVALSLVALIEYVFKYSWVLSRPGPAGADPPDDGRHRAGAANPSDHHSSGT